MSVTTTIPASKFRQDFGKYVALVKTQDFIVTKNGKPVALWTSPTKDKLAIARELAGSIHAEVNFEAARAARCDFIVTRNSTDCANSPVPCLDAAGALAHLAENESSR